MIIDERKVNLAEADIEQWLWENPRAVTVVSCRTVAEWVYRQFNVPSGVADLVGVTEHGSIVVVEVKNTAIHADALTQVTRYAADLKEICDQASWSLDMWDEDHYIYRVVVGKSVDFKTLLEARAMNIEVMTFGVSLSLDLYERSLTEEEKDRRYAENKHTGKGEVGQRLIRRHLETHYTESEDEPGKAADYDASDCLEFVI